MSWRDHSRRVISEVVRKSGWKTEQELRKALREAYPFGMRQYHPYKVWCDEVKKQMRRLGFGKIDEDPQQPGLF